MLKIKDNIDLKELEKYGLKYFSNDDERICCYIQDNEECEWCKGNRTFKNKKRKMMWNENN